MTEQEAHAIRKLIKDIQNPSGGVASSYEFVDGLFTQTGGVGHAESARRLDSEDYKLGWKVCAAEVKQYLEFILTAHNKDLVRYAGRTEKAKCKNPAHHKPRQKPKPR